MPFTPDDDNAPPTKQGGFTPDPEPPSINAQHPALTDKQRAIAQNLMTESPERREQYLRNLGFEVKPPSIGSVGGEAEIRLPGERTYRKLEESSGFWDNVGRLASFATPQGFRDLVDWLALGRPMSGRNVIYPETGERDPNRAEAIKDITDIGGQFAVGTGATLGAIPGTAVATASPLTGPLSPGVAAGGAALATGGAYLGGSAVQSVLSKLGEQYGVSPASDQEILEQGALGALSVPVGNVIGKGVTNAVPMIGRGLQKPYKWYQTYQPKAQQVLEGISGRTEQEAAETAAREAERAAAVKASQARLDAIANKVQAENAARDAARQAAKEASSMKAARTATEGSVKASDAAVIAENRRILFSTKQKTKEFRKELKDLKEELRSVIDDARAQKIDPTEHGEYDAISRDIARVENQIAENDKIIAEFSDKINEAQTRGAQYRETLAGRNAEEAARQAAALRQGAPKIPEGTVKPPEAPIPSKPSAESNIDKLIKAKEEATKRAIEREISRYDVSRSAAETRGEAFKAASEVGGEAWDEARVIANAVEAAAHRHRLNLMKESHEDVMKMLMDVGLPEDQAEIQALIIKDRASRAIPSPAPTSAVTPEIVQPMVDRMAEDATQRASKQLGEEVRVQVGKSLSPNIFLRAGLEGATGALALAGKGIEKSPEWLRQLPMGARNLLEKLTGVDIPKEKIGELAIRDPAVRHAIEMILSRPAKMAAGVTIAPEHPFAEKKPNRMKSR